MNDKSIKGTPQNINKYILYYKDVISKHGITIVNALNKHWFMCTIILVMNIINMR